MKEPPEASTIWHELAKLLIPMTQRVFLARFGKAIEVHVRQGEDGTAQFGFSLAKPGLLPTALEREWFSGFTAGYRAAVDLGMDLFQPAEEEETQ